MICTPPNGKSRAPRPGFKSISMISKYSASKRNASSRKIAFTDNSLPIACRSFSNQSTISPTRNNAIPTPGLESAVYTFSANHDNALATSFVAPRAITALVSPLDCASRSTCVKNMTCVLREPGRPQTRTLFPRDTRWTACFWSMSRFWARFWHATDIEQLECYQSAA
jgi:hypothetical protein